MLGTVKYGPELLNQEITIDAKALSASKALQFGPINIKLFAENGLFALLRRATMLHYH